ncbi:class I SAM-dependent DNA methyltransferase (plasmid) [Streptomyces sp. CA-142005]|uniref:class I SAM-dependent DNA methyltransferase n=1 Tax=Streptomyces sp. CA-142005 TaxID=3240052 RepID=UPI003D8DD40A
MADDYDDITSGIDYAQCLNGYDELIRQYGAPGKRLLDIGCGTGVDAVGFRTLGYSVTGIDFSQKMISRARVRPGAEGIRFTVADVRSLPAVGLCDIVTGMGDLVNYLLTESDVLDAFDGIYRVLASNGLLIFDASTACNFRRYAEGYVRTGPGQVDSWSGAEFEPGARLVRRLDRFTSRNGRDWKIGTYRNTVRHYAPAAIVSMLENSSLLPLGVYGMRRGHIQEGVDEEEHRKAVYVARRWDLPAARTAHGCTGCSAPWSLRGMLAR